MHVIVNRQENNLTEVLVHVLGVNKYINSFGKFGLVVSNFKPKKRTIKTRVFMATSQAWEPPVCQNSHVLDEILCQAL